MRIIHTADWHLCDRLGRVNRTDDLKHRVERVAERCHEHAVDLLLIAGDLFSEQASVDDMTDALKHVHKTFDSFFSRGGTILAITGNHDRDARINMVRAGMSLAAPAVVRGGMLPGGRMYLLNGRAVATLETSAGDQVQFVLVPYPFPSRYDLSTDDYRTKEEESRLLQGLVADWVTNVVPAKPEFNPRLPTVLVAHLHVRGAVLNAVSKFVLTERDDVVLDAGFLPTAWAYTALGHIHLPQSLGGRPNVRYPGSLDRLDFGETHDGHGVLLVEIGPAGLVREPECLPIPATPFRSIDLVHAETDLPRLADLPDREATIVKVTVGPTTTGPSRDEITREVRRLFPRLYELKWTEPACPAGDAGPTWTSRAVGYEAKVRDYLTHELKDDPDQEAVLALADRFLPDGGEP
jgi:DNA repair protein SbcD/Mre11